MKANKLRHCWFCGAELGNYADYDRYDTCGKPECDRETRLAIEEERREAHENLDRERGWS